MATRTSIATDDFNRAGPGLGANWANLAAGVNGTITITASTKFTSDTAGLTAAARWVGAGTFTNDHYASAVMVTDSSGSASYGIGVCVRASADTDGNRDYYSFERLGDGAFRFAKTVNGTRTDFIQDSSPSLSVGGRIELEAEGSTIRCLIDGVAVGGSYTVTDTDLTTGVPGITARGDSALSCGDDWIGGSLTTGATSASAPPLRAFPLSVLQH